MQVLQELDTIGQCLQEEYNHLQQQFEWLADSTRIKLKESGGIEQWQL